MFSLMVEAGRLSRDHVPARPRLEEAPARRGFLEPADFARLRDALPAYLREPASFLYLSGWRKARCAHFNGSVIVNSSLTITTCSRRDRDVASRALQEQTRIHAAAAGELLEVTRRTWESRSRVSVRLPRRPASGRRFPEGLGIACRTVGLRRPWSTTCAGPAHATSCVLA